MRNKFILCGVAVVLMFCAPAFGQLTGNYTCANGNPGSAFNYGDIGAFFTDCETLGITGPVTLLVFDDGGPFVSTASYGLGVANTGGDIAIPGISATATVSVRAAPGEFPVVQGSGGVATSFNVSATIAVQESHVRFEGLELIGGSSAGISIYGNPLINVEIRRCRVHGVTVGPGISIYSDVGGPMTDSVLENNVIWNCAGGSAGFGTFQRGALAIRRAAPTTVIRHNTVIHNSAVASSGAFGYLGGSLGVNTFVFEGNIFINSTSGRPVLDIVAGFDPVAANRNIYYATGGATFHSAAATFPDFAAWQASARDPQGLAVDPQLLSIVLNSENFHIGSGSPAVNLAVGSPTTIDVEGDPRPHGAAPDAGADEITGPPPEIEVLQGVTNVNDGGTFNAGNVSVAGAPFTFTVRNTGVGNLILTGTPAVALAIVNNCDPTSVVQVQPTPTTMATNQTAPFTVLVDPTAVGPFSLTISMNNNDPDENPFNFTINGTAVPANAAATASVPAGSTFAGPVGGPFTLLVNPGAPMTAATIQLTDAEANAITVTSIVPPAVVPTGIVAPPIPAPGQPLVLAWTGTADATNPPGTYTWVVNFTDSGSSIPVSANVGIQIANLPPTHVPALGVAGDGSMANPYLAEITESVNGSVSLDIATATDSNTGQAVTLAGPAVQVSGPIGTGFQFSFAVGLLRVAPAGALVPSDVGLQVWQATLTDGTANVQIRVSITVNPVPQITTASLPNGLEGAAYNETAMSSGGTGALTVTLLSGSLPAGLAVAASGAITGTPTVAPVTANFVLTVTDSLGANSSRGLSITVAVNPALNPAITTSTPLLDGQAGTAYAALAFTATNGTPGYTWAQTGGTLPPGMSFSAAGVLDGTPTTAGLYSFTIRVTDTAAKFGTKLFDLTIDAAPVPPPAGSGGSDDGGCSAAPAGGVLGLVLTAIPMLRRRRDGK